MPTLGCNDCPACLKEGRQSKGSYFMNPTMSYYSCPNGCIEPQTEPGTCPTCGTALSRSLLPVGLRGVCVCSRHGIYAASDVPSIREILERLRDQELQ